MDGKKIMMSGIQPSGILKWLRFSARHGIIDGKNTEGVA